GDEKPVLGCPFERGVGPAAASRVGASPCGDKARTGPYPLSPFARGAYETSDEKQANPRLRIPRSVAPSRGRQVLFVGRPVDRRARGVLGRVVRIEVEREGSSRERQGARWRRLGRGGGVTRRDTRSWRLRFASHARNGRLIDAGRE